MEGPKVIVVNGFGACSDWLRNVEAKPDEEVTVGSQHFASEWLKIVLRIL